jgi:hypothetical protein
MATSDFSRPKLITAGFSAILGIESYRDANFLAFWSYFLLAAFFFLMTLRVDEKSRWHRLFVNVIGAGGIGLFCYLLYRRYTA